MRVSYELIASSFSAAKWVLKYLNMTPSLHLKSLSSNIPPIPHSHPLSFGKKKWAFPFLRPLQDPEPLLLPQDFCHWHSMPPCLQRWPACEFTINHSALDSRVPPLGASILSQYPSSPPAQSPSWPPPRLRAQLELPVNQPHSYTGHQWGGCYILWPLYPKLFYGPRKQSTVECI